MGGLGATLVATTILLAVCTLALAALKLLSPAKTSPSLRLVARQPLDGQRAVYLVEAGGRCFLLGSGDGGLRLLAELDPVCAHATAPRVAQAAS